MFADEVVSSSSIATGQVVEWLVWSAIVGYSDRTTHVFLPLHDRGVDGIVRRVDDEAMCAVQVKGRTSLVAGGIETNISLSALEDLRVSFVIALLNPATITLGDIVYVIDAEDVVRLGSPPNGPQGPKIGVFLPYPPRSDSRWSRYACPLPDLAARLFLSAGVPTSAPRSPRSAWSPPARPLVPAPPRQRTLIGHLAELEVMRLLGEPPTLNTFKSFPDIEEAEYLVRHRPSGNIRAVQVKCLIVADDQARSVVGFHGPSFVASPLTDVVVLAWREDQDAFDDNAWLIPAIDVPQLVSIDQFTFLLHLRTSAATPTRFDKYRVQRSRIASLMEARVAPQP